MVIMGISNEYHLNLSYELHLNNVRKGTKSVQYGFKVTEELAKKIEYEREIDGTTLAGFFNDALRFYINHREERRLELWRMEKEQAEQGEENYHRTSEERRDPVS